MGSCENGVLNGKVLPALLISSEPDAGGIKKALERGLDKDNIRVINKHNYPEAAARGEAILRQCRRRHVDFIGQYGWAVLTPENVVTAYAGMMVNQHPGPLRTGRLGFGGKGMLGSAVHSAVLHFAKTVGRAFPFTEATAHRVTERYDEGAVLKVKQVPIMNDDEVPDLQQRVLPAEYEVQVETLLDFALGRVQELDLPDIIFPSEEKILAEAMRIARAAFPRG